jgi:membrane protease YdiL (CAAX protease family)
MRLRALASFVVFVVLSQLLEAGVSWVVFVPLRLLDPNDSSWRPSLFIAYEGIVVAAALVASLVAARIQRRRLADYGFAASGAGRHLIAGSAWGLGAVALLVGAIAALDGFKVTGLVLHGASILTYSVAWLITFFLLGLAEEATFRATGMFTLSDVIGLWPAAAATTLIFSALHYFNKPNETVADALSVGLLGLFMAFTVIRTGRIWWAVGFHALFDYAALFLFGAPNTGNNGGQPIATRLLAGVFHGPEWLTGGRTGIEASWLVFPIIALLFIAFDRAYRSR